MTAVRIRDSASLTCNACDTRHIPDTDTVSPLTFSYLCNLCGFWVHPDCASLPNPIIHFQHHQHSLFLTYNLPISAHSKCFICSDIPKESSGVYFCLNCPNYLVHIRCALTHPDKFNPVFIRDALVTDLARLPLADDRKSLIPYITQRQVDDDDDHQKDLHPHPLLVVDEDDDRVCNACVELISAPDPFVTCSRCPDFFLHSCCGRLPVTIQHRAHQQHPLHLSPKAPLSGSEGFSCKGCSLRCNGFAYSCNTCHDFTMDVLCALLNPAITHQSHDSTHILFMSARTHFSSDQTCNCCSSVLSGICYECSICRNFKLHLRCALLPETVRHVLHEEHPLQLTKKPEIIDEWCEICEEHLGEGRWFYCCADCNQSFHVDCVPAVDGLSKIKLGSLVRVVGHGCPLELVRSDDGDCAGRRCGFCRQILNFSGGLAYQCRNCFFCTHHHCAQKYLVNT